MTTRKMARWPLIIFATLVWGQANYISGFDSGTDVSLCVFNDMFFHEKHAACDRVWVNGPAMVGTRAWRKISGDEVSQ